ncbi:MAG: UDP-N-acetylmuramoyl-L-alanine--D-glutamate ligase [Eubacteriales bacterium]|nr:UDP-N-acetylmuramoyl-L-alanine--D-glutamate ligase [Eubacteriales bacterium]
MKKALILGYGTSGKGSAKLLINLGYEVYFFDESIAKTGDFVNLAGRDSWEIVQDKDLVVLSPGVSKNHTIVEYAEKCGIEIVGEIELGYRHCKGDVIAVTGTNGKTTTTLLINRILNLAGIESKALGNIGESFANEMADDNGQDKVLVLEISSYQLETVKTFRPHFALCLNVTPDHLQRHKTMAVYTAMKQRIFCNQTSSDYAILNYDCTVTRNMGDKVKGRLYYYSINHRVKGTYVADGNIYFLDQDRERVCSVADTQIESDFNLSNALAAITVAKLLNIDNDVIVKAISTFEMPKYRRQYIGNINGVKFFNDSKATNFDSTINACKAVKGSVALIIGGYDKGISYQPFFDALPSNVGFIAVCGDNSDRIMEFLPLVHSYHFVRCNQLKRATALALESGMDNVLFSPTTSSFDRYSGYEERGEHFDRIFKELLSEKDKKS